MQADKRYATIREDIMKKLISYGKLSKKEKRKLDLTNRQTWGPVNPVTRKPENSRAYNRQKAKQWERIRYDMA